VRHIQQYLRAYTERPPDDPKRRVPKRRRRPKHEPDERERRIAEIGRPWGGYVLTFDCETEPDPLTGQRLRFGLYRIHGVNEDEQVQHLQAGTLDRAALDAIVEEGIFYDPALLTEHDQELLHAWAAEQHAACRQAGYAFRCMDAATFSRKVFYPWVYREGALCIGHNLPYDLSRLATRWGTIDRGPFAGGFRLTLCDCGHDICLSHPPIRIKHLGAHKNRIDFRAVSGRLPSGQKTGKTYRGKFLDTMTLGRALLGPGRMTCAAWASGPASRQNCSRWHGRRSMVGHSHLSI
jgi:hypothetical protein